MYPDWTNERAAGFTLLELLVVIAIIGILAMVVMVSISDSRDRGRIAAGQAFETQLYRTLPLVGEWRFDEGSGSSAYDSSGYNNTGVLTGGTSYGEGLYESGLEFDGTSGGMTIGHPGIEMDPNAFTISVWVRPGNQDSWFIVPVSAGTDHGLRYFAATQRIGVMITQSSDVNNRIRYSANDSVPQGKWTHIAVSINGLDIKIYINGALDSEYTETIPIANWAGGWNIGRRSASQGWYLGTMDDLRIFAGTIQDPV